LVITFFILLLVVIQTSWHLPHTLELHSVRIVFLAQVVPTPLEATSDVAQPAQAPLLHMEAALLVKPLNALVVHGRARLQRRVLPLEVHLVQQPALLGLLGHLLAQHLVQLVQLAQVPTKSFLQLAL
jgi:hypothetical protein